MREVIASATRTLLIVTPYLDKVGAAFLSDQISAALDRDVRGKIAVRSGIGADDTNTPALQLLARKVGGTRLDESFDLVQLSETDEGGVAYGIHAKVIIADGRRAYVGSANLTRNGLDRNLEIGIVVDGDAAHDLSVALEGATSGEHVRRLTWQALAKSSLP